MPARHAADRTRGAGLARTPGYALLEVLITLGVSLVALSALVKFQGELFRGDATARARSQAVLLAEQRLETLHAALTAGGVEAVAGGSDAWTSDLIPAGDDAAARYTRTWSVAGDDVTATAQIEVAVEWSDPNGAATVHLATQMDSVPIAYGAARLIARDFIQLEDL
jgi:Tfp pilus assembly protein PilV